MSRVSVVSCQTMSVSVCFLIPTIFLKIPAEWAQAVLVVVVSPSCTYHHHVQTADPLSCRHSLPL